MNTLKAFAMGEAYRDPPLMVFDWDKAARIIKEKNATAASAGLSGDWEYTGGEIFTDGKPNTDERTFLASTWATPELEIDGEVIECYLMEEDVPKEWGAPLYNIKWPKSSLAILEEEEV